MTRRALLPLGALLLSACQNTPPPYPPPEQRTTFGTFRPYRISRIVSMSDGDLMTHVVSDVLGPVDGWSWTGKHPVLKVLPRVNRNIQYVADLAIADATFKSTGPVNITFEVNGHPLETVRYAQPGKFQFAKDVPEAWIVPGKDALLGAEIDKVWISPSDGTKLGFILTKIGLTEK